MNQIDTQALDSSNDDATHMEKDSAYEYCSNCGVKLSGLYCHSCGQSSKSMIKFFGEVTRELLEDTIGYDSRIKHSIVPLLIKPGRITLDYIKGKRFYYVLPFRLYLITSLILILLVKGVTDTEQLKYDNIVQNESGQELTEEEKQQVSEEINEALSQVGEATIPSSQKNDDDLEINLSFSNSENKENKQQDVSDNSSDELKITENSDEQSSGSTEKEKPPQPDENDSLEQEDEQTGRSINLQWDEESQQLAGIDEMEESWLKSFLLVINPKLKKWKDDPKPLVDSFFEVLPYMMFIILPVFAIFLKLFYAFSKRYYIEHLVFLLHNHAFIYMVLMIQIISEFTAEKMLKLESSAAHMTANTLDGLASLLFYWMIVYVFLAMKRFYQQGWAATIAKTLLLSFIYVVLISFGFTLTLGFGAYQA